MSTFIRRLGKTHESIRDGTSRHFQRGCLGKKASPAREGRLDRIHGLRRRIRRIRIRLLHAGFGRAAVAIGVNLGVFGVLLFFLIYLYPLRKKWGWLGRQGNSRHWLDFHVILGSAAPVVIALHSSFKFGGIAGMAFWVMALVTLSGFIGRYLYSQIPRSLNAAELSIQEIQDMEGRLRWDAEEKNEKIGAELLDLLALPSRDRVAHTSLVVALCWMIWLDLKRPFQVSWLRLRAGGFGPWLVSLFGILPTRSAHLERAIHMARRQASLSKRVLFLSRTKQVFSLWHVVHRPFSYSFAILAIVHIVVVMGMGYL